MVVLVGEGEVDFHRLFPDGDPPAAGTILNLQVLENLKLDLDDEEFFPLKIFIRQEMLSVWQELKANDQPKIKSQVLIGSPSVGKSIVFFLHALRRAHEGEKVIYFRKTTYDTATSLFCMQKLDDGKIQVQYNRNIPKDKKINEQQRSKHSPTCS